MRSLELYTQWIGHDLEDHGPQSGGFRPAFYEGLRGEDEPVAKIPFFRRSPDVSLAPGFFEIPEPLATRVHTWQAAPDHLEPGEEDPTFDSQAFDPFREISIRGGDSVELGVPAFIRELAR